MPILGFNYFGKNLHRILSNWRHIGILTYKWYGWFLGFSAICKDAYKNNSFHGILTKKELECVSGLRYCTVQFLCQ